MVISWRLGVDGIAEGLKDDAFGGFPAADGHEPNEGAFPDGCDLVFTPGKVNDGLKDGLEPVWGVSVEGLDEDV